MHTWGPSWSWSYGSWIFNYMCKQFLLLLTSWVRISLMERCTRYNIIWLSLTVTCDRSVVFSINKADRDDTTDILLKVWLNTITRNAYFFISCFERIIVKSSMRILFSVLYLLVFSFMHSNLIHKWKLWDPTANGVTWIIGDLVRIRKYKLSYFFY